MKPSIKVLPSIITVPCKGVPGEGAVIFTPALFVVWAATHAVGRSIPVRVRIRNRKQRIATIQFNMEVYGGQLAQLK
jgi:hypothetical protein